MKILSPHTLLAAFLAAPILAGCQAASAPPPKAPFTDYRYEKPGTTRKITPQDLPAPYATKSAANGPNLVARPNNVWPQAPAGFKVELYTTDVQEPRDDYHRAQWRLLRRRESRWRHQNLPRHHSRRTSRSRPSVFATGLKSALRHRLLSAGTESSICLHRRYRRDHSCPLFQRRPEAHRQGGSNRYAAEWRQSLDARSGFLP